MAALLKTISIKTKEMESNYLETKEQIYNVFVTQIFIVQFSECNKFTCKNKQTNKQSINQMKSRSFF